MDEILPRFTSMLLNVLSKLAGPKGLEIKVGGEGGKRKCIFMFDKISYNFVDI